MHVTLIVTTKFVQLYSFTITGFMQLNILYSIFCVAAAAKAKVHLLIVDVVVEPEV